MVIPTKVYQAAAAGRAVVSADTPALREVFTPEEDVLAVRPVMPARSPPCCGVFAIRPISAPRIGAAAGRLLGEHLDRRAQGARLGSVLAEAFPDLAERLAAAESAPMAAVLARAPVG